MYGNYWTGREGNGEGGDEILNLEGCGRGSDSRLAAENGRGNVP